MSSGCNGNIVSSLSIADLAVWNMVDTHLRIFQNDIEEAYPRLVAFHTKIAALPGIKSYLQSDARYDKVSGNGLG